MQPTQREKVFWREIAVGILGLLRQSGRPLDAPTAEMVSVLSKR